MEWEPLARHYDPLKAGSIDGTDTEPHDHGVIRAIQADYYPNSRVVGNSKKTLFVARLHPKTSEDKVKKTFSQFGKVIRCRLVRDLVTGFSKRYAFIEYDDEHSVYRAYRDGNKMELDGCELFVDYECERTMNGWVPRRLGGGFGGKKESGQLRFGGRDRPFRKPIVIMSERSHSNKEESYSSNWERNRHRWERPRSNYGSSHKHRYQS